MLANKDAQSQNYTSSLEDIVGMKDYHEGKASTISGIEMPDGENGKTVVIHFNEMKPGMTQSGNGYIWENAEPYHYLKDVSFKKLTSSDKIRKKPLFFGPYKLAKIVRGQSVTWVPNKYYWRGTPKLSQITASVVSPNSVSQSIKSNKFDVTQVINSQWQNINSTKNVNFIAKVPLQYTYLGFKVGKYNSTLGKNVIDKNAKLNNKALRQAIAYGMNVNQVYKRYSSGLTFRIPTLIPKQFGDYFDKDAKGYSFNLKKGEELLDKAGYKKHGTYRVQPNGKPLTIRLAAMSGSSIQDAVIQNYIQQWKKMGLHVVLTGGRLIEFNSFYDKLKNDAPNVDMFIGAWSLSSEPSPNDLYSETAQFNYSRFVTKKNYIQQWKKMGLHVVLTGGRLIEFNSFYDKLKNDAPNVDMFIGAWSLSSEPSPNDLYSETAQFNYSRFVTKKNNELLSEMDSQKAFNHKYRVKKFHEWQQYMNDQAYVVPLTNSYSIMAINDKLTGYSLQPSKSNGNGFPNWYYVAYKK